MMSFPVITACSDMLYVFAQTIAPESVQAISNKINGNLVSQVLSWSNSCKYNALPNKSQYSYMASNIVASCTFTFIFRINKHGVTWVC